jgi:phosphatidylglycerophosphate synthase
MREKVIAMWPIEERIFFRSVTIPLAQKLKKSRITPEQIAVFGLLIALLASFFILKTGESYVFNIMAAATIYLSYFFDKLDGDLARAKKTNSDYGGWFEGFLDRLGEIALTVSVVVVTNSVLIGMLAVSFPLLFTYFNESTRNLGNGNKVPGKKSFLSYGYTRGRHFLLLIFLVLINMMGIFLVLLAMGNIYVVALFLVKYREFRKNKKL